MIISLLTLSQQIKSQLSKEALDHLWGLTCEVDRLSRKVVVTKRRGVQ